jgi:hypothetical protein
MRLGPVSRVIRKDKKELAETSRVLYDSVITCVIEQLHARTTQRCVLTVAQYLRVDWKASVANTIAAQLQRTADIATLCLELISRVQRRARGLPIVEGGAKAGKQGSKQCAKPREQSSASYQTVA